MGSPRHPIGQELLDLKEKTSWSWARMALELERITGMPGLSHTTLLRYATGKSVPASHLYTGYLRKAIRQVTFELVE